MYEYKTPTQSQHLQDPILYGGINPNGIGMSAGAGVHVESPKDQLVGGSIKAMKGDVFFGSDRKGENYGLGGQVTGAQLSGRLGTEKSPAMVEATGTLGDLGGKATVSKDTAEVSANADLVSATAKGQVSNLGTSNRDVTLGGEASLGIGAGFKGGLHYGDADADGFREYGFTVGGKILGGGSLTYKSEDPLGDAVGVLPGGNFLRGQGNLTHQAGSALTSVGNTISGAWNSVFGGGEQKPAAETKAAPAAEPKAEPKPEPKQDASPVGGGGGW